VGVQDIQVDPQGHVWVAAGGTKLTRFMPEKEKWQAFDLPVIWRNPFLSPIREGEAAIWATGLAGLPDGHKRHETAYRLDIKTGQLSSGINLFDHKPPPDDPWHDDPLNYCYMMDQDQDGNFLCTASVPSGIIRGNRETDESIFYPTPTRHATPAAVTAIIKIAFGLANSMPTTLASWISTPTTSKSSPRALNTSRPIMRALIIAVTSGRPP